MTLNADASPACALRTSLVVSAGGCDGSMADRTAVMGWGAGGLLLVLLEAAVAGTPGSAVIG